MKDINNSEVMKAIEEFNKTLDEYYKAFNEYLLGVIKKDHEYSIFHPTLFRLATELQVDFFKLPDSLIERLLDINFEVFLHCDNPVDFYSFRLFILDKNRFEILATIVERADAETELAKRFISKGIWEEYSNLPKRNFDFYRGSEQRNLLSELEEERKNELNSVREIEQNNGDGLHSSGVLDDTNHTESNVFDTVTENLEKGEKIIGITEGVLGKGLSIIKSIISIRGFFN